MDWFQPTQAIVLLLLGAGATHLSQRRVEQIKAEKQALAAAQARLHEAELRLRDERRRIYLQVLDPYIEVLHALGNGLPAAEANARLGSVNHRKAAFELKLVGTDEVVGAFNVFARYIVDARTLPTESPGTLLRNWASLLLAIRKSVGEPGTSITPRDMVVDWINDIDVVFPAAADRTAPAVGAGSLTNR